MMKYVLIYLAAVNLLGAGAVVLDKWLARRGRRRIRERQRMTPAACLFWAPATDRRKKQRLHAGRFFYSMYLKGKTCEAAAPCGQNLLTTAETVEKCFFDARAHEKTPSRGRAHCCL